MNQHNAFPKERALHLSVAGHSVVGRLRERNADEAGGDENISVIILSFSQISHDSEGVHIKSR